MVFVTIQAICGEAIDGGYIIGKNIVGWDTVAVNCCCFCLIYVLWLIQTIDTPNNCILYILT